MKIKDLQRIIRDAKSIGFRQVVILGGEPLIHKEIHRLLAELRRIRDRAAPLNLVLRTNFASTLPKEILLEIALAVDQVVVSVDGTETTHDARRGEGAYRRTVKNLEAYQEAVASIPKAADLSLACVMKADDIRGAAGASVRELADKLKIRRVRFRPVLPLGRADLWEEPPTMEALAATADPMELLEYGFDLSNTCGLGQNIYIEPSGNALPCYALREFTGLGNVIEEGLSKIINSKKFKELGSHTVDTIEKCKTCRFRYLCGGACRAWGGEETQFDLDAPPLDCEMLQKRARALWNAAVEYLGSINSSGKTRHVDSTRAF